MQKAVRIEDAQLLHLANRAKTDHTIAGILQKKSSDAVKWKQRWFALYQNLLFYFENDCSPRPVGCIFLEGCYSERLVTPRSSREEKQVSLFVAAAFSLSRPLSGLLPIRMHAVTANWPELIQMDP